MLVLTRRPGESIIIGDGIKLTVVSVGPGRVKIGIDAPANVRIDREEIHTRIQQEHSTDVLAAVQSGELHGPGDQNTMIVSSAETSILHNRIVDQVPAQAAEKSAANRSEVRSSPSGISKYRMPRKPR